MEVASGIAAVLGAFGLSGAAGLNAWIPLLAVGVLQRLGEVDLGEPYDVLGTTPALIALAALFVLDFVGDKVPAIDHVLHAAGLVIAPVAGAVLFAAEAGTPTDLATVAALAAGAVTSGTVHAGRASLRPVSTGTTAGAGNPVLSALEDAASVVLTIAAVLVPILAFVLLLAALVGMFFVARRLRRRLAQRRGSRDTPRYVRIPRGPS